MNIYKSTYTDKKTGVEVDPFFILHKAKNLNAANQIAISHLYFYYSNLGKSTDFLNKLNKLVKITHIRLKKL
jgi:hypothetical protein